MQKNNRNASILIWAIFLSLIISIAFLSISTKINKSIKENTKTIYSNKINQSINKGTYQNEQLEDDEKIIFENPRYIIKNLKIKDKYNITFQGTSDAKADINIINGGPLKYLYIDKDLNSSSGIINSFSTIDITSGSGVLNLENIGGHASFVLSGSINFIAQDKKYKVIKTIGNKNFLKTTGEIKIN